MICYTYDQLGNYTGEHVHVKYQPLPLRYTEIKPPAGDYPVWRGQWELWDEPAAPIIAPSQVAAERDRRLRADFEFQGVMYQRDPISIQRIAGASQLAALAIAAGAQEGDLFWHGGSEPFGWIASDDTVTPMDAQTVLEFGRATAARETALVFAGRALRQMEPIPVDYADDKWWP